MTSTTPLKRTKLSIAFTAITAFTADVSPSGALVLDGANEVSGALVLDGINEAPGSVVVVGGAGTLVDGVTDETL